MTESSNPVRIAMIMGKMVGGGVEAVVMNYYRFINKKKYQFDFIVDIDSTNVPKKEIEKYGGKVIYIAPYQNILKYNKELDKIIKKYKYNIVHSHINAMSVFPLRIAYKNNVPIRISHNHSTMAKGESKKNILKLILRNFSTKFANNYLAPTLDTGLWLFGYKNREKIVVIKNAIELKKFEYNENYRLNIRKKLNLKENEFVIGFFGRLAWAKNPMFILDVFKNLKKNNIKFRLLIIGDGAMKSKIEEYILNNELSDAVIFLPNTSEIYKYYQAIDILAFPSHYEGLGMVSVEAQISGLPVINSVHVPNEVFLSSNAYFLSLDTNEWTNKIIEISEREFVRVSLVSKAKEKGYDIYDAALKLERYYDKLLSQL